MFTYKFKNGTIAQGTLEQILAIAKVLGEPIFGIERLSVAPKGFYESSSKGIIPITEMNDVHIKNAINKITYQFYETLGREKDIRVYLEKFPRLVEDNPKLQELYEELVKRAKEYKE